MEYKLKQRVLCTNDTHKSEVGIIEEIAELDALVEDKDGRQYEENVYTVMLYHKDGSIYFEDFLESELVLDQL